MSAAVLLSVMAPTVGSASPAPGAKPVARAANDAGAFAAALEEAAPADPVVAAPPARVEMAETAEPVTLTGEGDLAPATDNPVADPGVLPQQTAPSIRFPSLPVVADVSAEGEGEGEGESAAGPDLQAASLEAAPPPVSGDDTAAGLSDERAEASRPAERTRERVPQTESDDDARVPGRSQSAKANEPGPATAETGEVRPRSESGGFDQIVTPVASARAREVAGALSAVIAPVRPGKAAVSSEPVASTIDAGDPAVDDREADARSSVQAPLAAETPRVRDVIDRALARAPAQGPVSAEGPAAKAEPRPAETVASGLISAAAAGSDTGAAGARAELVPAVLPSAVVEEPAAPAPPASISATEARPAEPSQAPGLSTLSRSTVETTAQITAQIARRMEGRSTRFEIALTPDDLGRVDISLDVDADGAIRATLAFDNPVAAAELRGRADELRRQLIEAGFTLSEDALSFSGRDPSAGQGGAFSREGDQRDARAFGAASRLTAEADLSLQTPRWISLNLTPAGVDMKV